MAKRTRQNEDRKFIGVCTLVSSWNGIGTFLYLFIRSHSQTIVLTPRGPWKVLFSEPFHENQISIVYGHYWGWVCSQPQASSENSYKGGSLPHRYEVPPASYCVADRLLNQGDGCGHCSAVYRHEWIVRERRILSFQWVVSQPSASLVNCLWHAQCNYRLLGIKV